MQRRAAAALGALLVIATGTAVARAKFTSTWTPPGLQAMSFVGQAVVALVISDDMSLRMSAEEALAGELTERDLRGLAAYRIIPREELRDTARAKVWFERTGATGVVSMRLVDLSRESSPAAVVWSSATYGSFWSYYPYSWGNTITIVPGRNDTRIVIETLIFDLKGDRLVWAGTSESTNPKSVRAVVEDIVDATADELRERGLAQR
jgi:hypothetical protein